MELCLCPSQKLLFPNPNPNISSSSSKPYYLLSLARRPSHSVLTVHSRSLSSRSLVARASESDGASSGTSYGRDDRDSVATLEDISPVVATESPEVEKESPAAEKESPAAEPEEAVNVDPLLTAEEEQTPIFEFLEKLNIDTSDPYTLALYGGSSLFVLWLSSAVVGAIDAIPVFPKLMELVGLGYTFWFTYRYLIFKSKREELFAKIEELKEEIIG